MLLLFQSALTRPELRAEPLAFSARRTRHNLVGGDTVEEIDEAGQSSMR